MDDIAALTECNEQFIEAWRRGSWEQLQTVLGADFGYLDGRTGEAWETGRYVAELRRSVDPTLTIDQLAIHVAGDTATVSARTHSSTRPARANRYLDAYQRDDGRWRCVHACVWPLPGDGGDTVAG